MPAAVLLLPLNVLLMRDASVSAAKKKHYRRLYCPQCEVGYLEGEKCGCYPRNGDPKDYEELQARCLEARRMARSGQFRSESDMPRSHIDELVIQRMAAERRKDYC